MNIAERFAALFSGRTDVAGIYNPDTNQTYTKHDTVTTETYQRHIDGTESLGVFPMRDDSTVRWSCIDVDTQDLDLALRLRSSLAGYGVAGYIERTKSKGYHVWMFWHESVPGSAIRRLLRAVLTEAGAPAKTELFPKQDALRSPGQVGNFVNLPYFGRLPDKRVMIEDSGRVISLLDFLDRVEQSTFPALFLGHSGPQIINTGNQSSGQNDPAVPKKGFIVSFGDRSGFYDGPPPLCVLTAMNTDAESGTRNETLTRLVGYWAGYVGLDYDETVEKVEEWNGQLSEPLDQDELDATVEKVMKGSYSYGCSRIREIAVFRDGCNWGECGLYRPGAVDELPVLNNRPAADDDEDEESEPEPEHDDAGTEEEQQESADAAVNEREITALLAPKGSILGDYVKLGMVITDAPRVFHLVNGLVLMATALGKRVAIRGFGSRPVYPNLYIVAVAPSGFYHKSTTTDLGKDVLKTFAPGKKLAEIMTPEAFIAEMALDSDRVVYIDEFGDMMRMWNRREYLNAMKGRLISAYDNRELSKSIRGAKGTGETDLVEDPCLSLMGTTTQHLLVSDGAMRLEDLQSGFTARILWVWSTRKEAFKRDWPWDTQKDIDAIGAQLEALREAVGDGIQADFTRCKDTYFDWMEHLEHKYRNGVTAETSGVVSRLGTFVMKVAVLLAASEHARIANRMLIIESSHVERAIVFVEWCVSRQEQMARDVFQFTEFAKARTKLLDELKRRGGRMNYSDCIRVLAREKRRVDELLDTLRASKEVRMVISPKKKGRGRPPKIVAFPNAVRDDEEDVA